MTGVTSSGLVAAGNAFLSSSDISGGTDVTFGSLIGTIVVASNGRTSGTTVLSGGQEIVSSGIASGTVVSNGGVQTLSSFALGIASATTVLDGGLLLVVAGQAFGAVLSSGAAASATGADVGFLGGTTVLSGATLVLVGAGPRTARASGTVLDGGEEIVSGSQAAEVAVRVNSGGLELLEASGALSGVTVSGGVVEIGVNGLLAAGVSFVSSGGGTVQLDEAKDYRNISTLVTGFASGDFIDFRAIAFSGSVLSWDQRTGLGYVTVANGGSSAAIGLLGTFVGGQTVSVTSGVTSVGLIAGANAGPQFTSASDGSGGTDVTFNPVFGTVDVSSGGIISNTTVSNGGLGQIFASGTARGTTVLSGGEEIVSASGSEQLALVNSGGLELVSSGGVLASATISGGTVEIGSGGQLSGSASFATSGGGTVQLDQAISYASAGAVISGFTLGDFIDFRAVGFTSGATSATWNQIVSSGANASGTLTVSSGTTSASITLLGQYLQGNFKISDDTHGGTVVADPLVVAQTDLLTNPQHT